MRRVIALDPGIVHIGVFGAEIDADGRIVRVTHCMCIDSTLVPQADAAGCVRHAHTYASWFLTQLQTKIDPDTHIVIEAQPPGSAGMPLEILIRERFAASMLTFYAPVHIHGRFGLRNLHHDTRKARSVMLAREALTQWAAAEVCGARAALALIDTLPRAHDCADAILLFILFCESLQQQKPKVPEPVCAEPADVFAFMRGCMHPRYQALQNVQLRADGGAAYPGTAAKLPGAGGAEP